MPGGPLRNRLTYDPGQGVGCGSPVPLYLGVQRHLGCSRHEPSSAPQNSRSLVLEPFLLKPTTFHKEVELKSNF